MVFKGTMSPPTPFVGITVNGLPEQTADGVFLEIKGVGLTVIVNVLVGPVQETEPLVNVGLTVIVAVIVWLVLLVAVKLGIPATFPLLAAGSPIAGLSLVQV